MSELGDRLAGVGLGVWVVFGVVVVVGSIVDMDDMVRHEGGMQGFDQRDEVEIVRHEGGCMVLPIGRW